MISSHLYKTLLLLTITTLGVIVFSFSHNARADQSTLCNGKFANPITDYCWSCVMPIKIAGISIFSSGQEDTQSNTDVVCTCAGPSGTFIDGKVGISTSFWEPITMVDVVRKPFCLAGLGGIDLGNVVDAPASGKSEIDGGATAKNVFYQVHWYVNPILYWLEVLLDNDCLERSPFDLAYMTEIDPMWNDDEMTMLINPDVFLYANPVAQLACSADCVTASAGWSNPLTYWCAGCQGSLFPMVGTVSNHIGIVDSTSLLLQRFTAKAHRELMIWGATGSDGMCYKYPKYMMDKTDYKYSMLFPVPQRKFNGKCCQPYGRTTALWGSGTTFPFYGEDVVYQIFRKRDCCAGSSVLNGAQ
ncbi:MAG: TraU family protein [Proteobacteria bacterium]|nr:TraU family protein [Pseudomonadota bacterium]